MKNRKKNVVILLKIKTLIYFIQVITGIWDPTGSKPGTQLVVDYLKKKGHGTEVAFFRLHTKLYPSFYFIEIT
jgi:hypothetical protein